MIILDTQINYTAIIISAVVAFITGLLTSTIPLWAKFKELRIASQAQVHNQQMDEDRLKAEIIKILDSQKDQDLNQKKFDFDQVKKALELAENSGSSTFPDKISGLKEYLIFLESIKRLSSAKVYFDYEDEYNLWAGGNGYRSAKGIVAYLTEFYTKYSHAYPLVAEKVNVLRHKYTDLEYEVTDVIANEPELKRDIIASYGGEFVKLRDDLDDIAQDLKQEFKEFDQLKRNYINAHLIL